MKLLNYEEFKINYIQESQDMIFDHVTLNEEIRSRGLVKIIKREFNNNELNCYIEYEINEGLLSRVIGGLTGLSLGKAVGRFLVKTFQIQEGTVLYKVFTSKLFYMAIGAAIGKSSPKK